MMPHQPLHSTPISSASLRIPSSGTHSESEENAIEILPHQPQEDKNQGLNNMQYLFQVPTASVIHTPLSHWNFSYLHISSWQ